MKWAGIAILLIIVFGFGIWVGINYFPKESTVSRTVEQQEKYPYLARRIFLDDPNDTILNFINLRRYLRTFVDSAPNFIGVYFEYLPTGTTIGVNDRETLFAASLIKIPMAMEVMKQVELGNVSLDEKLTIREDHIDKGFGDLWKRGVGTTLTVREALKYALVDSDNTAFMLLKDVISDKNLSEVFEYLDIPQDMTERGGGISAKNFSSILRSLYFSAYLSHESSSQLLEIMTSSSVHDMLAKGVPQDIRVANKIGVYDTGSKETWVYSDCGIFYVPKRPYTLCVMVKAASSHTTAERQISDISKVVFNYINDINVEKTSKK